MINAKIKHYKYACKHSCMFVCVFNHILIKNLLSKSLQLSSVILLSLSLIHRFQSSSLCQVFKRTDNNPDGPKLTHKTIQASPSLSACLSIHTCCLVNWIQTDLQRHGKERWREKDGEKKKRKERRGRKWGWNRDKRECVESCQQNKECTNNNNSLLHTHSAHFKSLFKLKCQNGL